MLSGSENGELFLWDMKNNIHVHTFPVWPGGVWSVAFSPHGQLAVTGGVSAGGLFHPGSGDTSALCRIYIDRSRLLHWRERSL
jgi:WD40 repeat protein